MCETTCASELQLQLLLFQMINHSAAKFLLYASSQGQILGITFPNIP